MLEQDPILQAKQSNQSEIMAKPNVIGVGIGKKESAGGKTDETCIVVLVRDKIPQAGLAADEMVPRQVDGVLTDVVSVGEIRALQARTDRWRPAPGGVSIGHYKITAGTLGCVVRDRASGQRLILSNNHVLANSNDAQPGDPILQPGPTDGGQVEADTIARLERFCPIRYNTDAPTCNLAKAYASLGNALAQLLGSQHRLSAFLEDLAAVNLVDAALARPLSDGAILDEIIDIGVPNGKTAAVLGMPVRKSGRTTAFTTGEINVIEATVNINYGSGRVATFENQIVAGPMSQGGDSGSLMLAADSLQAVGLLFAGSSQTTVFSPIQLVLDCLEVDL
ncbi:MAG: hypothetical protein JXA78_00210 [Anaerolineales bacterium]|nr:hypothetical protein [Anaerolineales bacterium]